MTSRASLRSLVLLIISTVLLASSQEAVLAGATFGYDDPASDGFPLLGWLSFGAVALLGLMPVGLWLRFRQGSRSAR